MSEEFQIVILSAFVTLVIGGGLTLSFLFFVDQGSTRAENDHILPHEDYIKPHEAELMDEKDIA